MVYVCAADQLAKVLCEGEYRAASVVIITFSDHITGL